MSQHCLWRRRKCRMRHAWRTIIVEEERQPKIRILYLQTKFVHALGDVLNVIKNYRWDDYQTCYRTTQGGPPKPKKSHPTSKCSSILAPNISWGGKWVPVSCMGIISIGSPVSRFRRHGPQGGRVVHSRMHAPSTAALNGLFIAFISNPFWAPRTRTKQIIDTRLRKNERVLCSQKHAKFS